jgi:AcrR family transcriptional regulator
VCYGSTVRSKDSPSGRTFADEARRRQLVECAIEVIADEGFAKASLSRIAQRAGVAKSVVLYHFANKDELVSHVLTAVSEASLEFVVPRAQAATTAWEGLRGSIEAVVDYIATHPKHALAGLETWNQTRSLPARAQLARDRGPGAIEQALVDGQRSGEFTDFDPHVMAVMVTQAIDAIVLEAALDPDLDVPAFGAELVAMFDRAIRRPNDQRGTHESSLDHRGGIAR